MRSGVRAVLALCTVWALCAVCVLAAAGCAPEPTVEQPSARLDGTFTAQFGVRTTLTGATVPGTGATATWVAHTSCPDTGCVATVSEVANPDAPGDPRPPSMVFDYVGGRWTSVTEVPSTCETSKGQSISVSGWQTYVLRPEDDGGLTGSYTNRSSIGGACRSSTQTVTLTRTGDADTSIEVADPRLVDPRVASAGAALWGEYREVQTNPQTGQVYPPETYAGNTQCLRTGERCLSYFVATDSPALLVMTFAEGQWTSRSAPTDSPCPDGTPGRAVLTGEYPLPQSLTNPISTLTGSQRTEQSGACRGALTIDAELDRLGDGPGPLP